MSKPPKIYHHPDIFQLESGGSLQGIDIAYHIYGKLNTRQDNVVWICHALTANSDPIEWWPGMVGKGKLFDPARYFIICANMPGSCYGSTGPLSINHDNGRPWFRSFPIFTIRDIVAAFDLLRKHLGIRRIQLLAGSSMGGHQALEWAIQKPNVIEKLVLIATNAVMSPWAIAFNQSQRMAIMSDRSFFLDCPTGGFDGLKAARSMALLSYRGMEAYNSSQAETNTEKISGFRAASYQDYQGIKLVSRFNAYSYFVLSQTMDTHNIGRGRGGVVPALLKIRAHTLIIAIASDLLFPPGELRFIHDQLPGSKYVVIDSKFGHDGFLLENEIISKHIKRFNETAAYEKKL